MLSRINVKFRSPECPNNFFKLDTHQMEVLDSTLSKFVQALGPWKLEVSFDRGNEEPVVCCLHNFEELGIVALVLY